MPNPSRTLRRTMGALAMVVAIAAGTWASRAWFAQSRAQAAAPAAASAPFAAEQQAVASGDGEIDIAPAAGATAFPGGLSAAQWQTLQARVDPGPQHDREVARIADLLEFQHRVARLRELRDDPGAAAERHTLARQVDAGIATHLALRETSGGEAVLLKTAVLAELEPDPAQRARALDAWRSDWAGAHPPEADPRVADYQRREAAAVAAWQSRPASQRDPVQLARQLQQLQVAVFNPANEGGR